MPDLAITFTDEYLEECDREENNRINLNQLLNLTGEPIILNTIGAVKFRELILMYSNNKGGQR